MGEENTFPTTSELIFPIWGSRFPRAGLCCANGMKPVFNAGGSRTPVALMELYTAVMSPWDEARSKR